MDITAFVSSASMMMSQSNVQQQVNLSLMKTTMNNAETRSTELIKTMEQSVRPHVGSEFDVRG